MVLGIVLYCISPVVRYFLNYFKDAVHQREIRFFGMEHVIMMLLAVILITIGSMRAKRQPDDKQKFRAMAIFFTIALLVILSSIPWQFSPLVSRPYFRSF
jgi:NADH:ubiquinone oxidoreductase subunit 2 (subunit N)